LIYTMKTSTIKTPRYDGKRPDLGQPRGKL
jgi:hypothetical protein